MWERGKKAKSPTDSLCPNPHRRISNPLQEQHEGGTSSEQVTNAEEVNTYQSF